MEHVAFRKEVIGTGERVDVLSMDQQGIIIEIVR